MAQAANPRSADVRGLRHNSDYWWLWAGQAVSVIGDEVFTITLTLWLAIVVVDDANWAPLAVAAVMVSEALPIMFLSPIAGVYADRWNRRRIMLVADAARCVLVAGLAVVIFAAPALSKGALLAITYSVSALVSTATQFFGPARFAVLAEVVDDADRERAASLTTGTVAFAGIIGPALGAGLLVVAGAQWAMLLNACSFAVSFAAIAKVRRGSPGTRRSTVERERLWREFAAGLRYLTGNRALRMVLLSSAAVAVVTSSTSPLEIFFVTQNLHGSAQLYGILGTVASLGAVTGAGVVAVFARRLPATTMYAYGLVASGIVLVWFSRTTTPLGALIVMFTDGFIMAVVNSMVGPLTMRSTPGELLGRVSTALQPPTEVASLASMAAGAWLASAALHDLDATVAGVHFGPIDTIFFVVGLLVVVIGLVTARAFTRRPPQLGTPS